MLPDTATPSLMPRRLSPLKGLLPFLRPYRARVVLAFMLLCLGSATILVVPLAFRDLIDFGFGDKARKNGGLLGALSLNGHFLALFGLAGFWALVISARFYIVSWIGERVTADLRNAVYQRVLGQSPQFFETLQTGEVLSRLTGDTTLIQTVVGSSISMGLRSMFQFIGGMVMLAVTSFHLFSLNLGLMALLVLPILAIGRKVKRLSRESQDRIADASALAGEILNAMPTVQAFTQEKPEARRFTECTERSFFTAMKRSRVRSALTVLIITAVTGTPGPGLLESVVNTVSDAVVGTLGLWRAPAQYAGAIADAEAAYGLPAGLLERLLWQESHYRADIISGAVSSSAGAKGIAQFMPATAVQYGVDPLDPFAAIDGAGRYLRDLYRQFGNWTEALAAYNWGPGNVRRKGLAAAPAETRNYYTGILADVGQGVA
jgi:ABC-type multidrug transport system fused ATPase/permease subunit